MSRAKRVLAPLLSIAAGLVGTLGNDAAFAQHPLETLSPGHWYEVPNSRLKSVDPCPSNNCSYTGIQGQIHVIKGWNGGAFATGYGNRGGLVVWGGGHNGYLGNEVYVFDVDLLRWDRVTEPVSNPSCSYFDAELQNGTPCSPHTYDYVDYHPGTNSFVKLGSASDHEKGGAGSPRVHLFDFDTNQWRRGARKPTFTSHTGASSAYDPNRDVFWLLPSYGDRFSKYDPNANQWTEYASEPMPIDAVSAIDPTRDLFVSVEGRQNKEIIVHDLANPGAGVDVNTTGDRTMELSKSHGFVWDPVNEVFVGWAGGTAVYTLQPPSGNWRTQSWVWTRVNPAGGNSVSPTSPAQNGTYSRWQYVPAFNVFVVVNDHDDNVYFYKLNGTAPGGGTGPSVTLTASEEEVGSGSSVDLSWSSDGTSCSASGDWTGSKGTSGSETVGPLTSDATYTLTCSNNDGSTSRSVSVDVVGTPTLSFSANPTSVVAGGNSVLSWSTTDASSCSAQDGWSGTKGASGSETVGPLNADTMFTLTCSGAGGSVSDSVTVTTDGDPGDPAEFVDEGFDGYSDGADPTGWLDTAGGNGLSEDDQFEVLTVSGDKAFGTTNVNSTNIHSHYSVSGSSVWTNYEYSGRMQITGANDGIGVTAFSDYPDSDSYYRLRREGQDSGTFKISTHGSGLSCVGQTDTGVFPATDIWYLFRLQAEDLGGETEVRAKVWQEGSAEPAQWQATCSDTGTRRTMGKVGLWAVVAGVDSGTKYWDDLQVTSLAASGSAPTLSFSADPSSVGDQGTTTLTWSAGNADSCTASGSWSGSRSATGSETVGPLGSTSTFELMCSNNFGNVTRTVTVTVQAGAPAPTMSFSADPSVVDAGDSTTLDWSSANADSCSASGGWSGPKATSGSESVGPINSDTTFTQTCSGPGGSLTQSVVVSAMQPNPPPNDPPSANNSSGGGGGVLGLFALTMLGMGFGCKACSKLRNGGPEDARV